MAPQPCDSDGRVVPHRIGFEPRHAELASQQVIENQARDVVCERMVLLTMPATSYAYL
jgi:hypothetical protein